MDKYVVPVGRRRKVYQYEPRWISHMKRSLVWDYFGMYKNGLEYDKRFTICLLCGAELDYPPDKSTSCQHSHLQQVHQDVWEEKFAVIVPKKKHETNRYKVCSRSETWKDVTKMLQKKIFASRWHEIYCEVYMSNSSTYTWNTIHSQEKKIMINENKQK